MMKHFRHRRSLLLATIALCGVAAVASAQISDVTVEVEPDHIGINGIVRPGSWTPMLMTLSNKSASARKVRCQWIIEDVDGDPVHFERVVTLTPQRDQQAWLYAMPPFNTPAEDPDWRLLILDDETGKLLDNRRLIVKQVLDPRDNMIGITSSLTLGLHRYAENLTRHEKVMFVRGLEPARLPDRWYGLSALQALIWTPDTTDPSSPDISTETLRALREWVQRGGHLIVVLPAFGEDIWTKSAIADMLPRVRIETVRGVRPPTVLGTLDEPRIDLKQFVPSAGVTVVSRNLAGEPWLVADRYGFGRVTLVGVDLSNRGVMRQGIPTNNSTIWGLVFGWRSKFLDSQKKLARENHANTSYIGSTQSGDVGYVVQSPIAMREAFGGALMLAIVIFLLYWLAAGPVGYAVLRVQRRTRHAWLAFVAMVVLFSAVCWGGALVMRPSHTRVSHVSMLDIDGVTGQVHSHSWLSLFVAHHGTIDVEIDPGEDQSGRNTLVSPGLPGAKYESVFVDPRPYTINVASPDETSPPWRATAKQFELDFMGKLHDARRDDSPGWVMPQSHRIALDSESRPRGQVSHGLPGKLIDVHVIFNPGDNAEPEVWKVGEWAPKQVIDVRPPAQTYLLGEYKFDPKAPNGEPWRGWLYDRVIANKGIDRYTKDDQSQTPIAPPAANELIAFSEILTFFSMLPPPEWWDDDFAAQVRRLYRSVGRQMDITALAKLRGIIIIGYLRDSPLPAPLSVDGELVRGEGWTAVRWIYPL